MEIAKDIGYILLGVVIAVVLFLLAVSIGCAVNGLSFGGQIVEWFGSTGTTDVATEAASAFSSLKMIA